eukprot:UN12503
MIIVMPFSLKIMQRFLYEITQIRNIECLELR